MSYSYYSSPMDYCYSDDDHNDSPPPQPEISIAAHNNHGPQAPRTFAVTFFHHTIHTTLTSSHDVIDSWLNYTLQIHRHRLHKLVIGLGVQWTPPPTPGTLPPAATLQLCIGSRCLIIQLLHLDSFPCSLRDFLEDPKNTFVGVWNYRDEDMLLGSHHGVVVSRVVDLRHVAAERVGVECRRVSMEGLVERVLGFELVGLDVKPSGVGRSDWEEYWLGLEQVRYACLDAFLSFLLGKELGAWNFA